VSYLGNYIISKDILSITLEKPFINGRMKQLFKIREDTLVAIDDTKEGGIYLPEGSIFRK